MVELKNVTLDQLDAVCAADIDNDKVCTAAIAAGASDPWPDEWRAMRDLFVRSKDRKGVEWILCLIDTAKGRVDGGQATSIAPLLCRAVLVGYELAKKQMAEELERVVS